MVIKKLKLNNFGRFNNKEIELTNKINLIYGENESGKTTIYNFIKAMLFGLERSRGKAAKNDTYSKYEPWENQSFYEGILNFESGNKKFRIERSFSKGVKKELLINEQDGEELSIEQGDLSNILYGLNENIFNNTIAIGQLNKTTDEGLVDELKNYTANFSMSGDGGVNVSNALERLRKQKKDLELKKRAVVEEQQEKSSKLQTEKEYIYNELQRKQLQYEDYRKLFSTNEEKVNRDQEILKRSTGIRRTAISVLIGMVFIAFTFIIRELYIKAGVVVFGCILIAFYNKLKINSVEKEIDKLYTINSGLNNLKGKLQSISEDIKDKQIMLSNIDERVKEILLDSEEEKKLSIEIEAVVRAYETISAVSLKLQRDIEDKLDCGASNVLAEITDYKYNDLKMDSKLNIRLNTEEKLIYANQLSNGTIDEIYFAVRMAFLDLFFKEEKMPVILDEAFVMYDDKRLMKTLKYLYESERQVIILSCHKREKEFLSKMGCQFNLVSLL